MFILGSVWPIVGNIIPKSLTSRSTQSCDTPSKPTVFPVYMCTVTI